MRENEGKSPRQLLPIARWVHHSASSPRYDLIAAPAAPPPCNDLQMLCSLRLVLAAIVTYYRSGS